MLDMTSCQVRQQARVPDDEQGVLRHPPGQVGLQIRQEAGVKGKAACRSPCSSAQDITVRDCRPQLERKCFPYVGKEYRPDGRVHNETYTWVNQKLEKLDDKNITKCHEVSTCNIEVHNLDGSYTIKMYFL